MSIIRKLTTELTRLIGYSSSTPHTVYLSAPQNVSLEIDFVAVDTMSCSVMEFRLDVPGLVDAEFDTLKEWGNELCRRITYLLENIGPLEYDENSKEVLIRSTPPVKQGGGTQFYEVILQAHADGNFTLRRYKSEQGTPGRTQVEIFCTHEVLKKLVGDLVDSIPES